MPWSCRILLQHHQKKNSKWTYGAIFLTLNICRKSTETECSKMSIRAVFWHYEYNKRFVFAKFKSCIFVSSKWTYEANFPTLNICRKSMKPQSGLKFLSKLCFGIMNTTKDSYLLNWKIAFLKRGKIRQESVLFSTVKRLRHRRDTDDNLEFWCSTQN